MRSRMQAGVQDISSYLEYAAISNDVKENWALAMDTGVPVAKIYCFWALIAILWPAVQCK